MVRDRLIHWLERGSGPCPHFQDRDMLSEDVKRVTCADCYKEFAIKSKAIRDYAFQMSEILLAADAKRLDDAKQRRKDAAAEANFEVTKTSIGEIWSVHRVYPGPTEETPKEQTFLAMFMNGEDADTYAQICSERVYNPNGKRSVFR